MSSSKLMDIVKQGHLVIPLFFLKHVKDFKIKIDEFIFLMYLYNLGNNFSFDPNKFTQDLNIDLTKTMSYIDVLTNKNLIKVDVVKNDKGLREEKVNLDEFYNKISLLTMDEVVNKENDDSNIYEVIEQEFGRTLSSMEYEIIKAWLDSNTSEDLIREALKEAVYNGVFNLRYIDKILYEWGKAGIKSPSDVESNRKKRHKDKNEINSDVDIEMVNWDWLDEDE